jgi:putative ABC transport system permease protein
MLSPRWRKTLRDLWVNKARTVLVVLAIAIGIIGVGSILTSYAILTREINRNYMDTNPASAVFFIDGVDTKLVNAVQDLPEIAQAEARRAVSSRLQMGPNEWMPIILYVVDDFDNLRVNTFYPERGGWSPAADEILIERSALSVIRRDVGDVAIIKTPNGSPQALTISGVVHDPGQAPAWMESRAYGYVTARALARLGEAPVFDELRVVVSENAIDRAAVRLTAEALRDWLEAEGYTVNRVEVPAPGEHPHNGQMMTLLFLLESFGVLALVLSGVLVATLINALMGQQVRQIGVMKAFGARRRQISGIYLGTVLILGALALVIGIPAGMWGGRAYAEFAATMLNFEIGSYAVGAWVYLIQIAAALFIPVLAAAYPVYQGSRTTVREAISDYGVNENAFGMRPIDALLARVQGLGRTFLLALRNTFRRQGRLLLTLLVLAAGGAVFMTALNTGASWTTTIDNQFAARRYDIMLDLQQPYPAEGLETIIRSVPGVADTETWLQASSSLAYPDGTNGDDFHLMAAAADTTMIDFPVLEGRWLRPDDANALVVNHVLLDHEPSIALGRNVTLEVNGQDTTWTVVGVVRQVGSGLAYANYDDFAALTELEGRTNHVLVSTEDDSPAAQAAVLQRLEEVLVKAEVIVVGAETGAIGRKVLDDHLVIIVVLLVIMAALVAAVGGLGLMSTMSLNVLERTREIGVMRAVGATRMTVLEVVMGEGVFIGGLSWLLAVVLSVPLTRLVGNISGDIFIETPLTIAYSLLGIGLWLGLVIILSALASSLPALRATELPVNQVLAYE